MVQYIWNKNLVKDLRNNKFAKAYLRAGLDEGLSIQVALADAIRTYGLKEFSAAVNLPSSNIVRAINPKSNITLKTLNSLFAHFKMRLTLEDFPVRISKKIA